MLSAFILGLACGGLWIRRRIDRIADPVRFLALVQVAMGLLALATLPLHSRDVPADEGGHERPGQYDFGYALFLLASHGIALAIMFPASFCAGMTLPLITYVLPPVWLMANAPSARSMAPTPWAPSSACSSRHTSACRCSA